MSFDILLAKLKSGGNLGSRVRNPKACILCSSPKAIQEYEATYLKTGRFVIEDPKKIKNLTLMERKNIITFHCQECGAERPEESLGYKYQFFWVTCKRCSCKTISPVIDKCLNCDQEAKDALLAIEKVEG